MHPFRSTRRTVIAAAAGAAVLLAVGGGTTAAIAASGDGAPTASPTPAACAPHLRAELRGAVPARLRSDLQHLRSLPKGAARAAERQAIRRTALAGGYGARAEELARIVAGGKAARLATAADLPASLRADLKALRTTQPRSDDRRAAAQRIEQKALAGDYGSTIQTRVKTVQARLQAACQANQQ
jgi:hypothetical protein